MNHISHKSKWRAAPAMTLGLALLLTGCDDLLQVDLPGTITTDALDNPDIAEVLVNSVVAQVECSYARFITGNPAGMSDVFLRIEGDMQLQYNDVVDRRNCNHSNNYSWFNPFQEARFTSIDTYQRLTDWTDEQLAGGLVEWESRQQMLAVAAIYASVPFTIFGEHLCEVTFDRGELFGPDSILGMAEQWATAGLGHILTHIAEYQVDDGSGNPGSDADARALPYGITDDAEDMAYGLRARIRWARGNVAGAVADASEVADDFVAVITRTAGSERERENFVYTEHFDFRTADVAGPVDWWVDPTGGTNPGGPWPVNPLGLLGERLIPFTGYRDLAISSNGRAVDAAGNAVTLTIDPLATLDGRVDVITGTLGSTDPGWIQQKYTDEGDPVTLVGGPEMLLIQAGGAATAGAAVGFIDQLRTTAGLPLVSTGYNPTSADEIENMIIEERRRQLFLEGRFWSTKIRNQGPTGTKLWFPRELDQLEDPEENVLQGGVRMRMQNSEFDLNDNINRGDRASLCILEQRPVNPNVV